MEGSTGGKVGAKVPAMTFEDDQLVMARNAATWIQGEYGAMRPLTGRGFGSKAFNGKAGGPVRPLTGRSTRQ